MAIKPPPLDNADLIRLGAGHFHGGCAFCHGAPGIPVSPIAQHMLPPPPDLTTSMRPWTDEELFWIVKHGIKYTGMPGWAALEREDEIWAVVAFLRQMPKLDPAGLPRACARQRSAARPERQGAGDRRLQSPEAPAPAPAAMGPRAAGRRVHWCRACTDSRPSFWPRRCRNTPRARAAAASCSRWLPISARRTSSGLADYYAEAGASRSSVRSDRTNPWSSAASSSQPTGDAANGIPACNACHGRDALADYPRLAGQSAAYMAGQLRLWRAGHHAATGGGAIMAPIARRLSEQDIAAATAYFASLPADPAARAGHDRRIGHCTGRSRRGAVCRLRRQPVRPQSQRAGGGRSLRS